MNSETIGPKEILVVGVTAGLTIQLASYAYKHYHVRDITTFILTYPGYSIASGSAVVAFGIMATRSMGSFMNLFQKPS